MPWPSMKAIMSSLTVDKSSAVGDMADSTYTVIVCCFGVNPPQQVELQTKLSPPADDTLERERAATRGGKAIPPATANAYLGYDLGSNRAERLDRAGFVRFDAKHGRQFRQVEQVMETFAGIYEY